MKPRQRVPMTHICHFSTTDELKGKHLTYENLKATVLKAGCFSVFEATETQHRARLFNRLSADRELELNIHPSWDQGDTRNGFPWTLVRKRGRS